MRALLDVNVLVALLDTDHVHHRPAAAWLEAYLKHGWASCAITQNGGIRILSQVQGGASSVKALTGRRRRSSSTRPRERAH